MRIFQVIEATSNSAVPGNETWLHNLYEPLLDLGHQVVFFSSLEGRLAMQHSSSRDRALFSEKLLENFRALNAQKPFDLFFAYLMDGMVDPLAIDEIRKTGVPTCNFSCNNTHQFENVDELSPHFDYSLHTEKNVREKFLAVGGNPIWWPMAANPKYYFPIAAQRDIPVSFVGENYANRAKYIYHLLRNGIDVHAFGPGWKRGSTSLWRSLAKRTKYLVLASLALSTARQASASARLAEHDFRRNLSVRFPLNTHGPIPDSDFVALYSRSSMSLGFLEVYAGHDPSTPLSQHLHLREFEAPMSGALYCTGYMDELAEMFEPDKEVLVYRNEHELLDKARYYLANPGQGEIIRRAGRKRALQSHTYQQRFVELFTFLGLEKK